MALTERLSFFEDFLSHYDTGAEARQALLSAAQTLAVTREEETATLLSRIEEENFRFKLSEAEREALALGTGLSRYTVDFCLLGLLLEPLHERYVTAGDSETLFYETMEDLIFKLRECLAVKGVAGTFVIGWYSGLFRRDIFRFGRLEFQKDILHFKGTEEDKKKLPVAPDTPALSLHIPSAGALTREAREDSYARAYDYFESYRCGGLLPIQCDSWLLYPDNKNIFPACRNMVDFLSDFDYLVGDPTENFSDAWRVFGRDANDLASLPTDTRLRSAIATHLRAGGKMGKGYGIRFQSRGK